MNRPSTIGVVLLAGGRAERMQEPQSPFPVYKPTLKIGDHSSYSVLQALARTALRRGHPVCIVTDARNEAAVRFELAEIAPARDSLVVAVDGGDGTATAVAVGARTLSTDYVLTFNTDTLVPVDVMARASRLAPFAHVTAFLTRRSSQNESLIGVRLTSFEEGWVDHWGEALQASAIAPSSMTHCSATGVYLMHRTFATTLDDHATSLEQECIPAAVLAGMVAGVVMYAPLPTYDFGTTERYHALLGDTALQRGLMQASGLDYWD